MFDFLYEFLARVGYDHPLHPMFVHTPAGVPTAALLLALVALVARRPEFARSARHCMVLAFLFSFPAILFGITDWQYYYQGTWLGSISVKMVMSGVLLIFLALAIFFGRGDRFASKLVLGFYVLAFLTVVAIGYVEDVHFSKCLL